jgi:NAD(P)-dependent dehydrogenase (short-subunit alcohol dehydrogenase family)
MDRPLNPGDRHLMRSAESHRHTINSFDSGGQQEMTILTERKGSLAGQVAIVTGGSGGIGRASCRALARECAQVVIVDLKKEAIDEVVAEFKLSENGADQSRLPVGMPFDVTLESDMNEMVNQTLERFGKIDVLVHCAGILRGKGCSPHFLHQVSLQEWDEVVDTNLKGTFLSNRAVLSAMIRQRNGHIINFSSTSGLKGRAFDSVYCATKFGVVGLSEALAEEVRQYGIRVHVIMPDAVNTPIWDQNGPVRAPGDSLPADRVGDLVSYLAGLPGDTVLGNLVIAPFQFRRRKKGARKLEGTEQTKEGCVDLSEKC